MLSDSIRIRASSLSDLFDCALRWAAKNLDGKYLPSSGAAHLGTSLHASTAVFDQAVIDQNPITPDDAASVFVNTLHHPENEVSWDSPINDAERIGLRLHVAYCTDIAPRQSYTAVESLCESLAIEMDNDLTIELTGTTDRIRETPAGLAISDIKSGKTRVNAQGQANAKSDAAQLAVYELIAAHSTGQEINGPAEIIAMQTTKTGRIATKELLNTKQVLIGSEYEPGLLEMASMYLRSGVFPPNSRSMLCSPKYCPIFNECHWHN